MSEKQYHSISHCKYLIQYHIIWCQKFRFTIPNGNAETVLKQILQKICNNYEYHINALEVMPDYIHIFVDVQHTVAPCDVARILKSISAIEILKAFPRFKRVYTKCGTLWTKGYFVSTAGNVNKATIIKYVEEQKKYDQ